MKLLLVIKSLNAEGGGAERVFVELANGMHARGHAVEVLTFDLPGGTSYYPLNKKIARVDLGIGKTGSSLPKFRLLFSLPRLRKSVLALNSELAVSFMHSSYVPLIISLLGTDAKAIASEHTNAPHFSTRFAQRLLTKFVSRIALAKTVPTAAIKEEYSAREAANVHVLSNPIKLSKFRHVVATKTGGSKRIICVGRFSKEKGQATLIKAFSELAIKFPDWELHLIGDGSMRSTIETHISSLDLKDRIKLKGNVKDIVQEYLAADLVVVPSHYEAFGLVTAEALAAARPVIGFADCVGTAALIEDDQNGLLVQPTPSRSTSLSTVMARAMKDPKLRERLAKAGPASVARFDLNKVLNEWETFLLSCHDGKYSNSTQ